MTQGEYRGLVVLEHERVGHVYDNLVCEMLWIRQPNSILGSAPFCGQHDKLSERRSLRKRPDQCLRRISVEPCFHLLTMGIASSDFYVVFERNKARSQCPAYVPAP